MKGVFNECHSVLVVGPLLKEDSQAKSLLDHVQGVLFIDGGVSWKSTWKDHLQSVIALSVGDGDSSSKELLDIVFPPQKNRSDLSLGLDNLLRCKEIHLVGFMGGRLDHQMINIGVVDHFVSAKGAKAFWYDQHHLVAYSLPSGEHQLNFNNTFSLITLQAQKVSIQGHVSYPVEGLKVDVLSDHTLSNQAQGLFSMSIERPITILMSSDE